MKAPTSANGRAGDRTISDVIDQEPQHVEAIHAPGAEMPIDDGDADTRAQLTKLSLGQMGCKPELSMAQDQVVTIEGREQRIKAGKDVLQAVIFGEITGLTGPKELPNAKSEAEKYTYGLVGRIEGVNVITGEMFKAAILYLPAGFHDMFLAEAETALAGAENRNLSIAFALEFWSIPAGNPRGYSWKAINKMPMQKHDPLARLRTRALAGVKVVALPGANAQKQIAAS